MKSYMITILLEPQEPESGRDAVVEAHWKTVPREEAIDLFFELGRLLFAGTEKCHE